MKDDATHPEAVSFEVDDTHAVSGLLQVPGKAVACCVMAHGAGAGMAHPFMAAVADGLGERRIATLRYQFPSMEQGLRRPSKRLPGLRPPCRWLQAASPLGRG